MTEPQSNRLTPGEGEIYQHLARMIEMGEQGVLATVIATKLSVPRHAGSKMIIHADGSLTGTIGGGASEALVIERAAAVLESGECQTVAINLAGEHGVCGGAMDIFLEPVQRTTPFFVVGAGHVGRAMVAVGRHLGFRFTVIDDRPELLAEAARLPGVHTLAAGPAELGARLSIPRRAAVLVCSRNHKLDAAYLEALLRLEQSGGRQFVYFGSLGSRAKAAKLRQIIGRLPELADRMTEVRLPVGIELGAESPNEIALSILAEALAVLRGVEPLAGPDGVSAYRVRGTAR